MSLFCLPLFYLIPLHSRSQTLSLANFLPKNDRLDSLRICVGDQTLSALKSLRLLLCGASAIGTELTRCLSSFSACQSSAGGSLTIADDDVISCNNSTAQCLFSSEDVGRRKCSVLAEEMKKRDPAMDIVPIGLMCVGKNRHIFSDEFFLETDVAIAATASGTSRVYIDGMCTWNQKPLIVAGTLSLPLSLSLSLSLSFSFHLVLSIALSLICY
jgi:molybdopterin/thiamine biosynthesis adenylyltransferase